MTYRFAGRALAALTLLAGLAPSVMADSVTVAQVLLYKPKQAGVEISTPTSTEQSACTVTLEQGRKLANGKQATAWVLKDGQGRVLRKFHDTTGTNQVNVWSYYRDGEEAYREVDSNSNRVADQFRWLGPNGSKWGIDSDEDGRIDTWLAISAEEASQEILAAVIARDYKRLQALMLTKEDLDTLELPASETARLKDKMAKAGDQFQKTTAALIKLSDKTAWVHLETKMPQTIPADTLGSKQDLVRYRHATILYQEGDGKEAKHNWLQTGEMIQVGRAWRIVQAPVPGVHVDEPDAVAGNAGTGPVAIPPGGDKIIEEELKPLDAKGPTPPTRAGVIEYNLKRAAVLEKIVGLFTKAEDASKRDVWLRQVADCYATASQQLDKSALTRLGQWRTALKDQKGSAILAYFTFREMSGEYAQKLQGDDKGPLKPEELQKLQDSWREKLAKFTDEFPTADDTPDACMQLGMVNEFIGKETEAKNWYNLLLKNFPSHAMAKKAQGCLDRLSLEGKDFELAGKTLGTGTDFDIKSLKGKAVVVYFWASWNQAAVSDFNKIKLTLAAQKSNATVVCVNLDNAMADGVKFLQTTPVEGVHLHSAGGLESPLAIKYGITVLPNMFLVGADGKVVSRSVQANTLEDELKKLSKDK